MGIKINQLPDLASVAGTDMFPADDSGGTTGKHTLAKVAEFAVNAFETTLGGISRTVKTAIDAIQTLLGSTSISGIGDGTVTGALSTMNGSLANIGETESAYLASTASIPSGTATGVASITLSPGTWVVVGKVTYQGGTANTYRLVMLGTSDGGNQYGWVQFLGISGYNCSAVNVRIITLTAQTTVHLSAQHNAGSAVNVAGGSNNTFVQAVRIA